MAFPQVPSTSGSNQTYRAVTLPASVEAGDLLLVCAGSDGAPVVRATSRQVKFECRRVILA
jgi:hypothetical protein